MLTKKTFEDFAEIFGNNAAGDCRGFKTAEQMDVLHGTINDAVYLFQHENSRFDADRFHQAIIDRAVECTCRWVWGADGLSKKGNCSAFSSVITKLMPGNAEYEALLYLADLLSCGEGKALVKSAIDSAVKNHS